MTTSTSVSRNSIIRQRKPARRRFRGPCGDLTFIAGENGKPLTKELFGHGGQVVKTLSVGFLADFEQHWRTHGRKVLDILAEKYPQAYFGGAVALAKSIKWDTAEEDLSDGAMTPDEIMDKLEQRVGPEGRRLFENFLRKVNKLQAEQQLEASTLIDGGESPPGSSSK